MDIFDERADSVIDLRREPVHATEVGRAVVVRMQIPAAVADGDKAAARPQEVAAFVPPPPQKWVDPRPNRPVVLHSADVFVDKNALCYVTDFSAGLYIVEYKG
jgi:hypothetical protein